MTDEEANDLRRKVEAGRVVVVRKPPWVCPVCREKSVTLLWWQEEVEAFKAVCCHCGYSFFS